MAGRLLYKRLFLDKPISLETVKTGTFKNRKDSLFAISALSQMASDPDWFSKVGRAHTHYVSLSLAYDRVIL